MPRSPAKIGTTAQLSKIRFLTRSYKIKELSYRNIILHVSCHIIPAYIPHAAWHSFTFMPMMTLITAYPMHSIVCGFLLL